MKPKEPRVSVRVSPELKSRLESVVTKTGIDETTLVRSALEAICDEAERSGMLTFPLAIGGKPTALATTAAEPKAGTSGYPPIRPDAHILNDESHKTTKRK